MKHEIGTQEAAMTEKGIDLFGKTAANTAMQAAVDFIKVNGLKGRVDLDAVVAELRRQIATALPAALDEARAAFDARMDSAATATFMASMRLAGINAVKAVAA
jgi:hypothetical protein